MKAKAVISTRPLADAEADCAFLEQRGITAIASPMLEVSAITIDDKALADDIDAIAFTSRHAPSHLMAAAPRLDRTQCFCVGEATANAARQSGFTDIITGGGDGKSLAGRITNTQPRHVLWAAGAHRGFDLAAELKGKKIATTILAVYEARKTEAITDAAQRAMRDGAVVLVHSGRAGENLSRLLDGGGISRGGNDLIAMSHAVAGLCGEGWHTITLADNRAAMLEAAIAIANTGDGTT